MTAVVVVGSASRDVAEDDPRGWRLGGAVAYAALTIARLGLRVTALLGADATAATAAELGLLRDAGVDLHVFQLAHGPVFENRETAGGRVQRAVAVGDRLPAAAARTTGGDAESARGWYLGPVGAELDDTWCAAIPDDACVALGWQGMLRSIAADGRVIHARPQASGLLRRADLVGVSRDDLAPDVTLDDVTSKLAPGATLVLTAGDRGGLVVGPAVHGLRPRRRYPAIGGGPPLDATGAGDVFLAVLFAARLEPRLLGGRAAAGLDLLLAAAAASLVVEQDGLTGVPTRSAIRDRVRESLAANARRTRGGPA